MKNLTELRSALADVSTQMRSLHDTIGDQSWTEDQKTQWDDLQTKHKQVRSQVEREETLRDSDQDFLNQNTEENDEQRNHNNGDNRGQVFEAFMRHGMQEMDAEQRTALREMRAQGAGVDAKGGYTVPTTMLARIMESMKAYGGIASLAQDLSTSTGNPIEWPTIDGTAIEGELLGENTQASEQDETLGSETLDAKKISSKVIRVSNELLMDSGVDIEGLLARRIAQRIGRTESRLLIAGSGTGSPKQPRGIATSAATGATGAVTLKVTAADVNALVHSVDPAYRNGPKESLAFNDNTLMLLENLKDLNDRPLWLPEIAGVAPSTILNRKYVIDQGIADIGVGAKFMFYGDWSHFILRRINYMTLKRLVERYAEFDQVGFLAFHRFDCVLEDLAAVKALTGK